MEGGGKDVLIPITLDLRDLPLEATGIVCGVAGRLAQGTSGLHSPAEHEEEEGGGGDSSQNGNGEAAEAVEISFLSTARAGTVIVRERELDRAVRALEVCSDVVEI